MIGGTIHNTTWTAPSAFPGRPRGALHVWRIDLRTADLDGARALLDTDERERERRLRSSEARDRFAASRGALRAILGRYTGVDPAALVFDYGDAGKPHLVSGDGLSFNLSHSGDLALCAVTDLGDVGVDVEAIRPLRDVERLARRNFSPEEVADWESLSPAGRLAGFYRVWTRKEAMLKAAGLGLARPLDRVDSRTGAFDDQRYWLTGLEPGAGYAAAVAVERAPERVDAWSWSM